MADPEARVVVTASDATSRAFASADRNLKSFARGVYSLRSVFAGFGVIVSGRMFANWIKDAIEVEKLTKDQARAIGDAGKAVSALNTEFQNLARTAATELAPKLEHAAKFWKEFFFPSSSQFGAASDAIREQVDAQITEVERLQRLLNTQTKGEANSNWFQRFLFGDHASNIADTTSDLAAARAELERLRALLDASRNGSQSTWMSPNDFFGGGPPDASQTAFQQRMRQEQEKAAAALAKGKDLSPEIAAFVERLEAAEKLTASMATEVEKQVEEWREAKSLFDEGLISAETLRRIDESQLGPIKVTAQRMKVEIKDLGEEAKRLAQSMGDSFQDAFAGWVLGAERSFGDLLKRMAVQFATSAIFKGLGSLFPGGSFFSSFFGGFRAGGGPVSAGKGYIVGERGPEWFMPGQSGMISPGGAIVINQSNSFSGGDVRQQAAAIAANNARLKQELKAEISDSRRRGRPI